MRSRELAARFEGYGDWRRRLSAALVGFHEWLSAQELDDPQTDLRIKQILERLHQDKLVVAFVAEFSRGKSELINAIFFADFGKRLLPSSAGRTTMCPTELLYDPSLPPSIRLLPIETRGRDGSVTEFKSYADEWMTLDLDLASADKMREALSRVSYTKQVPVSLARHYGLHDDGRSSASRRALDSDLVEIPCWRHAVINFPHPLLQQGLVILDTPGLNAIGTEPELTLSLLPNAHAVLFILAADAGVSQSDIEVWRDHLVGGDLANRDARLVVLNKIDGLWDELKTGREIDAEIAQQARTTALTLGVPITQVFPVSAQKALLAKVHGEDSLLGRSRLPALEAALSQQLIPAKKDLVGSAIRAELRLITSSVVNLLRARLAGIHEQLGELHSFRGKNADVVEHMMHRIKQEKASFERGLQRYTALRTVYTQQTNALYESIGLEALRATATRTRKRIEESPFTSGVRAAMSDFFGAIRGDLEHAARRTSEIHEMMEAMYRRFATEHGLERFTPPSFSMLKYRKEIDRLERAYNIHFNTLWNMVSKAKFTLMQRFFETVAMRVKHVYEIANRDLESWLKALMAPLESQVREHQLQLRRRLDSVKRIHQASDELEDRIAEIEHTEAGIRAQLVAIDAKMQIIDTLVDQPDELPLAANA